MSKFLRNPDRFFALTECHPIPVPDASDWRTSGSAAAPESQSTVDATSFLRSGLGCLDPAPLMLPSFGTVPQLKMLLALFSIKPSISAALRKFLRFPWRTSSDLLPMITTSRYGCVRFRLCRHAEAVISHSNAAAAFLRS